MSYLRIAAKKDSNQEIIVKALRKVGAFVYILDEPVDLLVGYQGKTWLFEIKDGALSASRRRLRPSQQKFFDEWTGGPVLKIETIGQALQALGISLD
jgi:hypothetical protein